ncbi:GntR family transcriptional regulator [Cohnella rhizosphaerae]|uniref:GntR family transcriptional regulator n=1 Tax=Cohnella rhizosphaerae TaxID=1457232 RepID=A0A9X4KS50_9BACL|nr:GntR family transcriptional regulator [Cohnella rhizosphaerae]MDG0809910.1 GntR family transcriptional regulator [Cohnella rhizosphaerae]
MGKPTLRQQAYARILEMIETGECPMGSVTSEVQLGRRLDMSRTPVRAALQQLELEGYVRIASKHGVLILDSSSQRVGDLLELIAAMALFAVCAAPPCRTRRAAGVVARHVGYVPRLERRRRAGGLRRLGRVRIRAPERADPGLQQ